MRTSIKHPEFSGNSPRNRGVSLSESDRVVPSHVILGLQQKLQPKDGNPGKGTFSGSSAFYFVDDDSYQEGLRVRVASGTKCLSHVSCPGTERA